MTDSEQKRAAKQFVKDWTGKGFEKQETQRFLDCSSTKCIRC